MDYVKSIRLAALACTQISGYDAEYSIRRIFRWYSKKFCTPLHLVEELPLHFILQNYWEEVYENLEDTQIDEETFELTESDEDRTQRLADQEELQALDDKELEQMSKEAGNRLAKEAQQNLEARIQKLENSRKDKKDTQEILKKITEKEDFFTRIELPAERLPENVSMNFDTDEAFDKFLDTDTFGLIESVKKNNL